MIFLDGATPSVVAFFTLGSVGLGTLQSGCRHNPYISIITPRPHKMTQRCFIFLFM